MSSAIVAGAIAVPVLVRGAARPRVAKGVAVIARSGARVLAARVPPASARVEMSRAAWTVARGSAIDSEVRVECNEVEVASKAPLAASVTALSALFLSAREALDRKEERDAREEEERQARVIEANKNNKNFAPKAKKQKVTPSMQASGLNRRERRKKEREEENA